MLIAGLLQVSVLPEMASTNRTFAPTLIEQVKQQASNYCREFCQY
jgi:hypothetical protein